MTQCIQDRFEFDELGSRGVVARFDGGTITSDAGGLLLREVDRRMGLLKRLSGCFVDRRDPERIEHSVEQLLAQRVYGLALGYEDLIVIDLDATDLPVYGHQEKRFFHGFYNHYCYLPLYIVAGEHLLGVRLRTSNIDASAGSLQEIQRIVRQIRERWPQVGIILRADSGFCRDELMSWCEGDESSGKHADYVFGFARNERLRKLIEPQMEQAGKLHHETGRAARVFTEFLYETRDSWSRPRRVVAKAEQIEGKENPRYLVTSLDAEQSPAQELYEKLYCARGDMENRIKEQLSLFADRVSAATMRANQLRLYFSAAAYLLMHGLRRLGLAGTELARAQCSTIRNRLLKIGAQVRITVRKVWIALASGYPYLDLFRTIHRQLRC
jgi:hypothetical protein